MEARDEIKVPDGLYAKDIPELLRRWDDDQAVFTVEMGGIGPGYEQCIHICVFELLHQRQKWENLLIDEEITSAMNEILWNNEDCKNLRPSGVQAGAAKNLAWHFLHDGYRETLEKCKDRTIQVSKRFPVPKG
jgi:hypothetical protein